MPYCFNFMEFKMNNQLIYENPKLLNQQEINEIIKNGGISNKKGAIFE